MQNITAFIIVSELYEQSSNLILMFAVNFMLKPLGNASILPLFTNYEKILGQTGLFSLGKATSLRKVGLISLFNGISTFMGYLMLKLQSNNSSGSVI